MSNHSLFHFIKTHSKELADLAARIEDQLYEQPQASLMQSRLYSEHLVKIISDIEGLESVYPLKHAERIHKLYRQNAIEEDVYMKLEWIRKKGNKAAHNMNDSEVDDALKAHKFLFELSVWYMQVYVSYDFEAPIYKLPVREKKHKLQELNIDKIVQPYLDQKLKKVDEMWSEVQRELEALKKEKEVARQEKLAELPAEKSSKTHTEGFPLLQYLDENGLQYVDNRDKKGSLWILGDWSINEKLLPLKQEKIYFRFSQKGGKASDYKPAWFLLNKGFIDTSYSEVAKGQNIDSESTRLEKAAEKQALADLVPVTEMYWQENGQIMIPVHLLNKKAADLGMASLEKAGFDSIRDLSDDALRKLYMSSKADFHRVLLDLYWLGFRFTGNLSAFQPEPYDRSADMELIVNSQADMEISRVVPVYLKEALETHSIKKIGDLNHHLKSSLSFVLKSDTDHLLDILRNDNCNVPELQTVSKIKGIETQTGENNDNDHDHGSVYTLKLHGEAAEFPEDIAERPLLELGIKGCNNLLEELARIGRHRLKDFPEVIDQLHIELSGVGPKAVQKMWNQLIELKGLAVSSAEPDDEAEKRIRFEGDELIIPDVALTIELMNSDFLGMDKTLDILKLNGIRTIKDLPSSLNELTKLERIGKVKIAKLFSFLPAVIKRAVNEEKISQMSVDDRIRFEVNSYRDWIGSITGSEDIAKQAKIARYVSLMKKRYEASKEGKHLTLEQLGQAEGVTRERIRQILAKGDNKVNAKTDVLATLLKQQMENNRILPWEYKTDFAEFVLKQAFENEGLYLITIGKQYFVTDMAEEELSEYMKGISEEFAQAFDLHVITHKDLEQFIENYLVEQEGNIRFSETVLREIISEQVRWLSEDQGVLKSIKKNKAVEMVMLQYPEGVEVYKKEEELNEKANDLMPGSFQGERAFTGVLGRDEIQDRILLWNRGVYIHASFITQDKEWVHSVQDIAERWLEEEGFIHVLKLYKEVEEEALKRNVPSEYALYTLIRRYPKETLSLPKFPAILPAGESRQANSEWIADFIREKGRPVTYEELYNLFVEKRGWKRFTLEFTLSSSDEIIQYKHGAYVLLSDYASITGDDLRILLNEIKYELESKPFIGVSLIFDKYEPLITQLGIKTKHVLYSVLKRIGIYNVRFPRYPYILSGNLDVDDISGKVLVENFIKDQGTIVAREEVLQFLEDLFGNNNAVLDIALLQSNDILYYSRGQYGEYIHRDIICMDDEMEREIQQYTKKKVEELIGLNGREYVMLDELYHAADLPALGNGIPWSKELYADILKKSGKFPIIGSYDEIIALPDGTITSDSKFIEYILRYHYDGAVKINVLKKFLINCKYSAHGQLLASVEEAMEKGETTFEQVGDEYITQELQGVNI